MKNKKKKGFTLVELVIVIAIIGILAAIAIPKYQQSKKQAAISAHKANVHMLESAATMRLADGVNEEITWKESDYAKEYVQKWPKVPDALKKELGENYTVIIKTNGDIEVKTETKPDNATN